MTEDQYRQIRREVGREEGVSFTAYQDSKGYWTIGIGRCIDARVPGAGLTPDEVEYLVSNTIKAADIGLQVAYSWYRGLDPARQRVCLQVVINCGLKGFASFKKMHAALARSDYDLAAEELLDSKAARDLPERYARLAAQLRTGTIQ